MISRIIRRYCHIPKWPEYSQNPGIGLMMGSFSATCFFTQAFIIHSFLGFSAFSSVVSAPSFFSSPSAGFTSFDSLSSSDKRQVSFKGRVLGGKGSL